MQPRFHCVLVFPGAALAAGSLPWSRPAGAPRGGFLERRPRGSSAARGSLRLPPVSCACSGNPILAPPPPRLAPPLGPQTPPSCSDWGEPTGPALRGSTGVRGAGALLPAVLHGPGQEATVALGSAASAAPAPPCQACSARPRRNVRPGMFRSSRQTSPSTGCGGASRGWGRGHEGGSQREAGHPLWRPLPTGRAAAEGAGLTPAPRPGSVLCPAPSQPGRAVRAAQLWEPQAPAPAPRTQAAPGACHTHSRRLSVTNEGAQLQPAQHRRDRVWHAHLDPAVPAAAGPRGWADLARLPLPLPPPTSSPPASPLSPCPNWPLG